MPLNTALLEVGRVHTAGLVTLLAATGYTVYVSEVTGDDAARTYPYVVVHPFPGTVLAGNVEGGITDYTAVWQTTVVGRDVAETQGGLDRVRAAVAGQSPTVTGWVCGQISQDVGDQPVRADPTENDPQTGRPLFYAVARFTTHSTVTD